jgi:hypothetical protein
MRLGRKLRRPKRKKPTGRGRHPGAARRQGRRFKIKRPAKVGVKQ